MGSSSSGDVIRLPRDAGEKPTIGYEPQAQLSGAIPRPVMIGRYSVIGELGVGGMGYVLIAYDPKLDRKVALKLLRERYRDDRRTTTGQARLIREAQALAQLSHPNVVTVHDVDNHGDQLYMAMELVDGESVEKWLKAPRPWREIVDVFIDAANGLSAAHVAGIIHRDFKPSNVLIGRDGRVVVVDFGLAKNDARPPSELGSPVLVGGSNGVMEVIGSTQDAKLTQAGRTVGTPAYMAPEQFLGLGADAKTDQFSFGVSLYEALYGDLPFPDATADDLIEMAESGHTLEAPDSMVPGWLFRVVQRLLQPRPEDRYASMHEVIAALQADPERRRRRIILGVTGGLVAVLGGLALYLQGAFDREQVCSGAADAMEEVWSSDHRDRMQAAFVATGKPFAAYAWRGVSEELDDYRDRWVELHTEVCEATNVRREQSPALMDARMSCLERGRRELDALVEQLVDADGGVVQRAGGAVQDLWDIEDCTTASVDDSAATDPATVRSIEEIDALLAQAKTIDRIGRPGPAFEAAEQALGLAERAGHAPTLARAHYWAGRLRISHSSDHKAAREDLVEAIGLAQRTTQPRLEAQAWATLMSLEASALGHTETAIGLRLPAELAVERAADPLSGATLARTMGLVYSYAGDFDEALEQFRGALDGFVSEGASYDTVAGLWTNIGVINARLERYDEAERALDEAIGIIEDNAGPSHPLLASALVNRGSVLMEKEDHELALASYDKARGIYEPLLSPSHERLLRTRVGVADALEQLDRLDEARAELEAVLPLLRGSETPDVELLAVTHEKLAGVFEKLARASADEPAEALWERSLQHYELAIEPLPGRSPLPVQVWPLRYHLCGLELERGRLDAALGHCTAAQTVLQELDAPDDKGIKDTLVRLAELHRRLGALETAATVLREGLVKELGAGRTGNAPELRLLLADILWESGRPQEAMDEAGRARHQLTQTGNDDLLDQTDRWLRSHRVGD